MDILKKIIESKIKEVEHRKKELPVEQLRQMPGYTRKCNSLKNALLNQGPSGIIAEFKQKSPSKGIINAGAEAEVVTKAYTDAGAAGLSVLTDYEYFGGSVENLAKARRANPGIPILRKDFIIDNYQIEEAKAFGADVILLIAANLEKEQAEKLARKAQSLGMEVLMEIHNDDELKMLNGFVDLAGVNNRNLKNFSVDVETSVKLSALIPERYVKISESGLKDAETIRYLKKHGFKGFLIGEMFMETANPGDTCKKLISEL